jgi:hypothetical protein
VSIGIIACSHCALVALMHLHSILTQTSHINCATAGAGGSYAGAGAGNVGAFGSGSGAYGDGGSGPGAAVGAGGAGGDSQLPNINEIDMSIQTDPRIMRMTVGEVSHLLHLFKYLQYIYVCMLLYVSVVVRGGELHNDVVLEPVSCDYLTVEQAVIGIPEVAVAYRFKVL